MEKKLIVRNYTQLIDFSFQQAFVSSLVMKLQLYVQQVNGALEETSQSVISGLPRILRDTQLLQQEALSLREKMVTVKEEIAQVMRNMFVKLCRYFDGSFVEKSILLLG